MSTAFDEFGDKFGKKFTATISPRRNEMNMNEMGRMGDRVSTKLKKNMRRLSPTVVLNTRVQYNCRRQAPHIFLQFGRHTVAHSPHFIHIHFIPPRRDRRGEFFPEFIAEFIKCSTQSSSRVASYAPLSPFLCFQWPLVTVILLLLALETSLRSQSVR